MTFENVREMSFLDVLILIPILKRELFLDNATYFSVIRFVRVWFERKAILEKQQTFSSTLWKEKKKQTFSSNLWNCFSPFLPPLTTWNTPIRLDDNNTLKLELESPLFLKMKIKTTYNTDQPKLTYKILSTANSVANY